MANCNQKFEDMLDGELIVEFEIPGRPSTKKTSQQIVFVTNKKTGDKIPRVLPSKLYAKYEKRAKEPCYEAWKYKGHEPLDFGIGIVLKIYLNSYIIGDETGYQQAVGDIIEKHGIIANDKYIHWMSDDTHMIHIDKFNPRAVIQIYRYRHPYEVYKKNKKAKPKTKKLDELDWM